jgi:hypothetical protein
MPIAIESLTEEDVGRVVIYVPHHATEGIKDGEAEVGLISSFNKSSVWVRYYTPYGELNLTGENTPTDELEWVPPHYIRSLKGGKCLITKLYLPEGRMYARVMGLTEAQAQQAVDRELPGHIQDVLPHLAEDEVDFLLSGIPRDQWVEMFEGVEGEEST